MERNNWKGKFYKKYRTYSQEVGNKYWMNSYKLRKPYLKKIADSFIGEEKNQEILELGCGAGQLMYYLDECGYRNVTGIDISNEQVVEAKKHGVKKVECCSASTHLKKNRIKYDVIIAIDVFEHYTIDELFNILKLLKKSMKTKAKLVLHIPNAEGIFGMHACFHDVTHMNYYTPHSIKQCLLSEGFSEVQVFEDRPIVHGLLSLIRALIWMTGSLVFRIIAVSETGRAGLCLTQNIFVTARK